MPVLPDPGVIPVHAKKAFVVPVINPTPAGDNPAMLATGIVVEPLDMDEVVVVRVPPGAGLVCASKHPPTTPAHGVAMHPTVVSSPDTPVPAAQIVSGLAAR